MGLLSSCGARASHCGGFPLCGAQALGHVCSRSCGAWALEHRHSSHGHGLMLPCGKWDLPGPGVEQVSPTPAGRFFTSEPPGKLHVFSWHLSKSRTELSLPSWVPHDSHHGAECSIGLMKTGHLTLGNLSGNFVALFLNPYLAWFPIGILRHK